MLCKTKDRGYTTVYESFNLTHNPHHPFSRNPSMLF